VLRGDPRSTNNQNLVNLGGLTAFRGGCYKYCLQGGLKPTVAASRGVHGAAAYLLGRPGESAGSKDARLAATLEGAQTHN